MRINLQAADLQTWLKAQSARRIVGFAGAPGSCPLAQWQIETRRLSPRILASSGLTWAPGRARWRARHTDRRTRQLPDWADRFARAVDAWSAGRPTQGFHDVPIRAKQALQILAMVR